MHRGNLSRDIRDSIVEPEGVDRRQWAETQLRNSIYECENGASVSDRSACIQQPANSLEGQTLPWKDGDPRDSICILQSRTTWSPTTYGQTFQRRQRAHAD